MRYRPLADGCDLSVSLVGLGTGGFGGEVDEATAVALLDRAREAGVTLVDTADAYKKGESERIIGRYLTDRRCRSSVVLATKAGSAQSVPAGVRGGSRAHLVAACEASLRRLQTDHIDLYQLHRPDFDTPIDETLDALSRLKDAGKIRYAGSSTFPAWLLSAAYTSEFGRVLVTEQAPYNFLDRQAETDVAPTLERFGRGMVSWSSLAGGILSGQYSPESVPPGSRLARKGRDSRFGRRVTAEAVSVAHRLGPLARSAGLTTAQLALCWLLGRPAMRSALVGPRTITQLDELLRSADRVLPDVIRTRMDALNPSGSAAADFHNATNWP